MFGFGDSNAFFFLSDRTCVIRCIDVLSYLHSVVHGRDSVYTAFTDGVGAHPDVLLQLVQVGELGRAAVHLEAGRFGMSRDPLTRQRFKFDSGKTIIKNPPQKSAFDILTVLVQHSCDMLLWCDVDTVQTFKCVFFILR